MIFDSRLFHFVKKEFLQLFRDPRMIFIALAAPLVQLLIFGYVATVDLKNVKTAVLDSDRTYYSRSYLSGFKNSGYFDFAYNVSNEKQMIYLMDRGDIQLGLHVPVNFGEYAVKRRGAEVLAIIDGTNSSAATIISGYINQINNIKNAEMAKSGFAANLLNLIDLRLRVWYNAELKSINFMVPAIFATVLMLISVILTASSIVKEKEKGTIEMLSVTPLRPYEIILGKLIPYSLVAIFDIILIFLLAILWFKVPMRGSFSLLLILGSIFLISGLGLGIFISTIAKTLRQTIVGAMIILLPSFMISGFIFPIENMPKIIQLVTYFIPLRYFLVITRGIFLKGSGIFYLWNNVWPLMLFGAVILTLSVLRFRKKIE